ncbi:hypothetical protein halTADL_0675 [Halohasta litchfieldiae]|nr:hypothetical protein [Halohasta litchfieldiae]ATW87475.1 hypothetical protein halTADL_0675 [Halohasta litchfieldiae]
MNYDFTEVYDDVVADVHEFGEHDEHISAKEMIEIDTTKYSNNEQWPLSFATAYSVGRKLENIRVSCSHRKHLLESDGEIDDDYNYDTHFLIADLFIVEVTLAAHNLAPNVHTQIKQQRQRFAEKYIKEDEIGSDERTPFHHESFDNFSLLDTEKIIDKSVDWLYILSKEFKNKFTYHENGTSRINLEKVIQNPSSFFRDDVWSWLDDRPKNDFKQSCVCLSVNSTTASVMLSLRAVEYCLRDWYEYDTDRQIKDRTWGQVISELEDHYQDSSDRPVLLSNLEGVIE